MLAAAECLLQLRLPADLHRHLGRVSAVWCSCKGKQPSTAGCSRLLHVVCMLKLSCVQDWGLLPEQHDGNAVLQRFRNNIEAVGGTDRVSVLRQPSWQALSTLMGSDWEAFDVRHG